MLLHRGRRLRPGRQQRERHGRRGAGGRGRIVSDTLLVARTGAVPGAPVVATTGEATVLQTGDVVVNVGGATATMTAAYRAVTLTGSAETDTDGDGLPDTYEALYDLDVLVPDSLADPDGDGAANLQGQPQQGTHPRGYYKRYLAEGATGSFLDTRISVANAGSVAVDGAVALPARRGRERGAAHHNPGSGAALHLPAVSAVARVEQLRHRRRVEHRGRRRLLDVLAGRESHGSRTPRPASRRLRPRVPRQGATGAAFDLST